jgi:hypothetical protein
VGFDVVHFGQVLPSFQLDECLELCCGLYPNLSMVFCKVKHDCHSHFSPYFSSNEKEKNNMEK